MGVKYLIAYATRFGTTLQVADAIAQTLQAEGKDVDILSIKDITSLNGYQAIFLGSAVNYGAWLPEAVEFVKTMQEDLNRIPVALFTVHITNVGDDEASRRKRHSFADEVRSLVNPVDEAFFAGKFDRRAASELLPRWLAWLVPTIDLRKWDLIRNWTKQAVIKLESQITS